MDVHRWRMFLTGRVQGVGLRYRARMLAEDFPITGGIRNLYDGRVELEIQGERSQLQQFYAQLGALPWIRIDKVEAEEIPVETGETGFHTWG